MALVLVAPVSADIHTIDSPGAVATTIIEDTIYSAGVTNGDVIILNPGTYYEHDITVPKDITIRANTSYSGTAANTIIDAQSSGRIFMMDYYRSFTIDNLTLQNGLPTDTEPYGGGIFSRSGDLVVTSSSFINCRSPMDGIYGGGGGAIFSSAGSNSLSVTSSSFTGCSAAQYGGAIESELGVTSIDKSTFTGCSVDTGGYGGAVGSWQDTMTITSSSFSGCTGTYGGTLDTGTNAHVTMHFNRIYGTGYQVYCDLLGTPSTVDAANNWWGTNSGPAAGSTFGTLTTSPYLRLGITAAPSSITTAQTSDVRANLTFNSAGTNTAGGGIFVPDTVPATFAVTSGPGSVAPLGSFFSSGAAPTTFAPSAAGTSTVSATIDGQTVSTSIAVTAAAPVITGISPSSGPEAGGTRVNITGTSLAGASVTFGSNAATINANTATAINMTAPAGTGTVTVTVTTAGGSATTSYEYVEAPEITGISPAAGPAEGGTLVNITGEDLEDVISVTFGSSPAFINGNTETAINTTSPAGYGTVTVTVTTPGGSDTISYTYVDAPAVTSVSPTSGPAAGGTTVTITGTGFTGATAVTFGSTAATGFTVDSVNQITATSPAGTGTVHIRVTTTGGTSATSSADQYTFVPVPAVTSVSPASGPEAGGTSVTVTGIGFTGATAVAFGSTAATGVSVVSDTTITATSPAGTGTADVMVTTPGGTSAASSADLFTYVAAPTVTSISPTAGPLVGGTSVTITGTGFTGAMAVAFGGTAASSFSVDSNTQITVISPAGTGTVDVTVTTPGGTSATSSADQFTYVAAPAVTSVSPTYGPAAGGSSVAFTGTGFTGATAVAFGGTAATGFTIDSDTSITATSPVGTGTVDITITTPGGTSTASPADQFTYIPAPTVTSISPTAGPAAGGTSVTITGTGFTGATAVAVGGTAAGSFTVNSDTQITATSPAGTGTVDVRVTAPGGTSETGVADQFTYIGPPVVSSVSPIAGPPAGGTLVTITGTGFVTGATVTFGGSAATGVIVVDPATITATTPAHAAGTVDVVVTNPDTQAGTLTNVFTFADLPSVSGILPASGTTAGGDTVTITGSRFVNGATVTFGGAAATGVSVGSGTSITATTPAHAPGAVDVVVTNPDTQAGTLTNGFTYITPPDAPTVTGIVPGSGQAIGGEVVTITGTGFITGATVTFGGAAATGVSIDSATSITATIPSHAAGMVDVVVTNPDTQTGTLTNGFMYTAPPTTVPTSVPTTAATTAPAPAPTYFQSDSGEPLGDFPSSLADPLMTVTVNIGGDSRAWQAVVTGTKLQDLIVTGTEQYGTFGICNPPAGSVFQYLGLEPARYGKITNAVIHITVPESWLDENNIAPGSIVLYHMTPDCWQPLPTTYLYTKDGTAYFSGQSAGFSQFAIAGTPAVLAPKVTAAATQEIVSTPELQYTPAPGAAEKAPVTTQTTTPPAATPQPAAPSPLLNIVLVIGAIGVLAGGGFIARRWWIRRKNPALFREYD